jgi:AcrR family transcriptional regulator
MTRQTQQQRTARTRGKLIAAASRCLARDGYGGSGTAHIAQEAGVSRGALQHHFPSRVALMQAAIRHIFEKRVAEFAAVLEGGEALRPEKLTAELWRAASATEVFVPWLELTVAARSDPELAEALREVTHEMRDRTSTVAGQLGPGISQLAELAFALMDGLALQQLAAPDPARRDRILTLLERLVAQYNPLETSP